MHRTLITVVLLAFSTTAQHPLSAQQDAGFAGALRWRNIGPYRGGRVTAVAGLASQPLVYYMGSTGGGVWKTEDAGTTWANVSDEFFQTGSVGAVAVADSNPAVVYVGMGEACLRGNLSAGDGVYKSTDAGKTWVHVGLPDSSQIGRIRIHPTNPNLVYVAAVGHPYGANVERGVFRSKDGGGTWQKILFVDDKTGAADIAMDPSNPQILYASTWQVLRTPWGITSTGPGGGLYKSSDGGDHWMRLTAGLPTSPLGKIGVTVSPVNPQRVWATVEADSKGGVYRSDDGGATWQLLNDDFNMTSRQYYYGHIFADPQDANTVYTFCAKYFYKSTDGGKTYTNVQTPHSDYHDLWIDPHDHRRMVNGSDGGASVTSNGGRTWSTLDNQPTSQFYTAITDNNAPYRVYGSQQDNSTVSIASRTNGGGITESDWHAVGGGESGYIAPTPAVPPVIFAGSFFGLMTRYQEPTGETRNVTIWPDYNGGRTAADVKYRFQWTYPIIVSHDGKAIYAGAQVVFRSANEGQSWEAISPDLTRNDKAKEHGGRLEEYYSTIFTIAESPREAGTIWAGSDDGLVHVTRNGGRDWQNVTPQALQPYTRVNVIEASPHDAGTAYLAVTRYQLDDFRPSIFKTTDYGKNWQQITSGIPEHSFVRVVREDPARKDLLYAGTERGVFYSLDGGGHWQSLQLNLPIVPITDLTLKNGDLIAATQGRSFWILDDVTPLHELGDAASTTAAQLFTQRDAIKTQRAGFGRAPSGAGQNPPAGAIVTYRLASAEPVTIEFADAAGTVIKRATSADRGGPPATAGMHRYVWDMRYPDAHGIDGGTHLSGGNLRGPVATPGSYEVRLTAGGNTLTKTLRILADPQSQASAADVQKQFDLLIAIRDKVSAIHDTVNEIRTLRAGVAARTEDAAVAKINTALAAVQDELVDLRFAGYDDQMLVFDLKLNNRMAALQGYVSRGDYAPTEQQYAVFKELSMQIDAALARFKALKIQIPPPR
jgi:photosystem II stability/assembly factor-like uncharacterized protein